ncbi:MAG: hypothetical protein V4487_05770 [Chlamydiota bacterium]
MATPISKLIPAVQIIDGVIISHCTHVPGTSTDYLLEIISNTRRVTTYKFGKQISLDDHDRTMVELTVRSKENRLPPLQLLFYEKNTKEINIKCDRCADQKTIVTDLETYAVRPIFCKYAQTTSKIDI